MQLACPMIESKNGPNAGECTPGALNAKWPKMGRVAIAEAVKAEIGDRRGAPIGNDRAKKNRNGQLTTSVFRQATEPASLARAIAAEKAGPATVLTAG
jgi:hypothetical protein